MQAQPASVTVVTLNWPPAWLNGTPFSCIDRIGRWRHSTSQPAPARLRRPAAGHSYHCPCPIHLLHPLRFTAASGGEDTLREPSCMLASGSEISACIGMLAFTCSKHGQKHVSCASPSCLCSSPSVSCCSARSQSVRFKSPISTHDTVSTVHAQSVSRPVCPSVRTGDISS